MTLHTGDNAVVIAAKPAVKRVFGADGLLYGVVAAGADVIKVCVTLSHDGFPDQHLRCHRLCQCCGVSGVSVYVKALNTVGARPGQKVVVESDTKKMLKIVSFVYLIPVVLFLAGYLITLALTASVAAQYTAAVLGAALGVVLAVWYDRRVKARGGLSFTIVRVF